MRILFDQGVPAPLREHLSGHVIDTAFERGWSDLRNSELLQRAEDDGYALLVTTDQSLRHQQNLAGRNLGVLVLLSTSWPRIQLRVDDIKAAVDVMGTGDVQEIGV
ncbi:MAG: hypothetical protein F4X25_08995 [Chloroflexi bacterium]|nr:hypothetical protein [Chloroflexota bacterium]